MSKIQKFVLSAALSLGVAHATSASAAELTPIKVTHATSSAILLYPAYLAKELGYFEKAGLDVEIVPVDGSALSLQALAAGQAHISLAGAGPFLAARENGLDAVFFFNNSPKSGFGAFVKEDSPIKAPADLKGARIGTGTADGGEVGFIRVVLSDQKFEQDKDFTFLTVGDGGPAAAAFLRNEIDAYAGSSHDAAILTARGLAVRDIVPAEYLTYFGAGYTALRSYIDENPTVIEGFGAALVQAAEFAADPANEEEALALLKKTNPIESENPAFAKALFDAQKYRLAPFEPDLGHGYNVPEQWEAWQASQIAAGSLKGPLPDLTAIYTNAFVEAWNAKGTQ